MAITFSSTSGTSGVTNIEITATERLDDTNYSKNYVISNDNKSLGMTVAQKAYAPVVKYITLSPSAISWTSSESTDSITVNSNDDWVVMSDGWIELSRMYSSRGNIERVNVVSGNGNTIIGIRCSENTGSTRTGGITAYCQSDSSITATTTVSQAGGYVKPYIMLGTYSMSVGSSSATTAVSVTSNVSWSAITDSRWITINTLTGSGDGSVSFTVDANESDIERRGSITVYNGELSAVLVISQQASSFKPYIILTPDAFNVASTGSTNTITVSANCEYDIAADVPWITVNAVSGSGNGSVSFTTASNSGLTDVGNIEFSNLDISRSVSVERQGMQKYLYASTNTISCSSSGGTFNVSVYSNINWSVSVDMGEGSISNRWMSVSPSSGSNDGSITISVASGTTYREGTVLLSSSKYGLSYAISVSQSKPSFNYIIYYTSTDGEVVQPNPNVIEEWNTRLISNTYSDGLGVMVFADDIEYIPQRAFADETRLASIVFPETITYIGEYAFANCTGFTGDLIIPDSVQTLEWGCFGNCGFNGIVTIGSGVTEIGIGAFEDSKINEVIIGKSVTDVDSFAFYGCEYLNSIYAYTTTQPIITREWFESAYRYTALYKISPIGTLHYPSGSDYSTWISALPSGWTAVADL